MPVKEQRSKNRWGMGLLLFAALCVAVYVASASRNEATPDATRSTSGSP